ncbi:alpha/beta fold hydrolase [Streptomyces chartreusis]|uniref:alpha/beta fold hydrolase n=1 Tax=Streptomyces chartreusis TaxID=1969 RepID=UPI002100AC7A|nr:alpha/beta hydrolase [Streptomyces chartreusis]
MLLHGFPSGPHQLRCLIDVLGSHYRLIAPNYPGFGHTQAPDDCPYSFDRLADIAEGLFHRLGIDRFVMYVFGFGLPIAERHLEWIAGLVVQNGNACEDGV